MIALVRGVITEDAEARVRELGQDGALEGEMAKSALWVPLASGDEVQGIISLQNLDRENAFSEGDVHLLTTLASSLSVALENARLFDETQRLLTETNERAAELAIINSVQEGLAAKLDMQAMYDLVGDKIHEIFDAQIVDIGLVEPDGMLHFPYSIERGVRFPDEPADPKRGFSGIVFETGAPVRVSDVAAWYEERGMDAPAPIQGEPVKSLLFVPLISGGKVIGRISLQSIDRADAFTEASERLLTTLAGSLSVALENARLFDETQRPSMCLRRVQHEEALLARTQVHPGAGGEVIGVLGAAVQHHHQRQMLSRPAGRHIELVVTRQRGVRVRACDELTAAGV